MGPGMTRGHDVKVSRVLRVWPAGVGVPSAHRGPLANSASWGRVNLTVFEVLGVF